MLECECDDLSHIMMSKSTLAHALTGTNLLVSIKIHLKFEAFFSILPLKASKNVKSKVFHDVTLASSYLSGEHYVYEIYNFTPVRNIYFREIFGAVTARWFAIAWGGNC